MERGQQSLKDVKDPEISATTSQMREGQTGQMTPGTDATSYFLYGHCALLKSAPSIQMVWPEMKDAAGLAR
jgi:hypothetical protein